jgi:hypothetical protein
VKANLNEDFEEMLRRGWQGVQKNTPQYEQLKDAFFGGALCAFNRCQLAAAQATEIQGFKLLESLNAEIEEHHKLVHSRAKLWIDIQKAGER